MCGREGSKHLYHKADVTGNELIMLSSKNMHTDLIVSAYYSIFLNLPLSQKNAMLQTSQLSN